MARQVLLQNTSRPIFPSIWTGRELEFDRASILAARGDKHKSLRSAWQPMFFTGRCDMQHPCMLVQVILHSISLGSLYRFNICPLSDCSLVWQPKLGSVE